MGGGGGELRPRNVGGQDLGEFFRGDVGFAVLIVLVHVLVLIIIIIVIIIIVIVVVDALLELVDVPFRSGGNAVGFECLRCIEVRVGDNAAPNIAPPIPATQPAIK